MCRDFRDHISRQFPHDEKLEGKAVGRKGYCFTEYVGRYSSFNAMKETFNRVARWYI
jgi:hypothetical protein